MSWLDAMLTDHRIKERTRDEAEAMYAVLVELLEYWEHGTPVHSGSLIAEEVRVIVKRIEQG
jgi:hypothetical protein